MPYPKRYAEDKGDTLRLLLCIHRGDHFKKINGAGNKKQQSCEIKSAHKIAMPVEKPRFFGKHRSFYKSYAPQHPGKGRTGTQFFIKTCIRQGKCNRNQN